MLYTHTIEYYSVFKRKDILTHATWMNLEDVMVSDIKIITKEQILYDSTFVRYLE
jgi:hypothetical protein